MRGRLLYTDKQNKTNEKTKSNNKHNDATVLWYFSASY